MSAAEAVQALAARYLVAWNGRDFEGMAACFAGPSAFVYPGGLRVSEDGAALAAALRRRFARMEAEGFDRAEVDRVEVRMASDDLAVIDLPGLRRLRADGSEIAAFDGMYLAVRTAEGWRLALGAAGDLGWRERGALVSRAPAAARSCEEGAA